MITLIPTLVSANRIADGRALPLNKHITLEVLFEADSLQAPVSGELYLPLENDHHHISGM